MLHVQVENKKIDGIIKVKNKTSKKFDWRDECVI